MSKFVFKLYKNIQNGRANIYVINIEFLCLIRNVDNSPLVEIVDLYERTVGKGDGGIDP